MEKKPYHHGELKKALIENGIEFINQYGEEKLSLRKVAEKCGVSNAAPYAHFKDKDDLNVRTKHRFFQSWAFVMLCFFITIRFTSTFCFHAKVFK